MQLSDSANYRKYFKKEMCEILYRFPFMCPSNTVVLFYKVLEMPLHDINTSVELWLYSKILSLVLFKPDNGLTVRPPFLAVSTIISK